MRFSESLSFTLFQTLLLAEAIITTAAAFNLVCDYEKLNNSLWHTKDGISSCVLRNVLNISTLDARVAEKIANNSENNVEVLGFCVLDGIAHFFPANLNLFFPLLILVELTGVELSELHQTDLVALTSIRFLHIEDNRLEFIEKDLFVYNQRLEVVSIARNRLSYIDADAFDHLARLRYLNLESNVCVSSIESEPPEIPNFIAQVKDKCGSCDYQRQQNLTVDSVRQRALIKTLQAEIEAIKAQNLRSLEITSNVTSELEVFKRRVAQKSSRSQSRVFLLTIMLAVMCVLSAIFALVIVWFIVHIRMQRAVKCEEIVTREETNRRRQRSVEIYGGRLEMQQRRRATIENVYEDIRRRESEPDYDKLDHY